MYEKIKIVDANRAYFDLDLSLLPGVNADFDATAAALTVTSLGATVSGIMSDVVFASGWDANGSDIVDDFNKQLKELATKVNLIINDLSNRKQKNPLWEIAGTNAASGCVALVSQGGWEFTTAGASNDQVILQPHSNTGVSGVNVAGAFLTDASPRFKVRLKIGDDEGVAIWAGLKLTNTPTVATDADQAFFRYQENVTDDETWQFIVSRAGTDVEFDTDIAVAAGVVDLEIRVNSDRTVMGYINGRPIHHTPWAALTTAIALKPFVGLQSYDASAKTLQVLDSPDNEASRVVDV